MTPERVRLFVGKQGKGKSTLAYHEARLEGKPIVIFDPRYQFDFASRRGLVTYGQGYFEDYIERAAFPIVFRPGKDVRESFEDFCEVVIEQRGLAVIVDEARYLMTAQAIDENLSELLRAYRQQGHSLYLTAHRMAHVHGDVAEPCDSIVFFGTHHKKSLERISDHASAEASEAVAALTGRDFLEWFDESETYVINRDAEAWREQISPQRKPEVSSRRVAA
jgi:hypothetical protein